MLQEQTDKKVFFLLHKQRVTPGGCRRSAGAKGIANQQKRLEKKTMVHIYSKFPEPGQPDNNRIE